MRAGEEKEARREVAIRLTPRQPQPATFSARNLPSRHNGCMKEPNHHASSQYIAALLALEIGCLCFVSRRVSRTAERDDRGCRTSAGFMNDAQVTVSMAGRCQVTSKVIDDWTKRGEMPRPEDRRNNVPE